MTSKKTARDLRSGAQLDRQQTTLGIAGRDGWSQMGPRTNVELARLVRAATWQAAGRTSAVGIFRDRAVLAMVRNRYPKAVSAFGESNIIALLREPQRGACSWDAARILAATNGESPPRPTPVLLGLLGTPCSSCKTAFRAARVARRETEHVEAVTAAGLSPEAAGRLRTPEQVASYADSARALRSATRPATPTSRKPPDPLYYTPRRRQLPER